MPFEGFWGSTLSGLTAAELAVTAAASRQLRDGVTAAVQRALEPLFAPGRVRQPRGIAWTEALHRALEHPRLLAVGGEDAADMPQLHVSLLTLGDCNRGATPSAAARLSKLPLEGSPGGCSLPSGRYRLAAARIGPSVYVAGGTGPEGDPCPEVLCFNTLSYRWDHHMLQSRMDPMPTPRYGHEAVGVMGRYLLCIGGKTTTIRDSPQGRDEVIGASSDVLDIVSGRWVPLPCCLRQPRVYFGAASIAASGASPAYVVVSGGLSLAGGQPSATSEGRLASTELLDVTNLPQLFAGASTAAPRAPLCWREGPRLLCPRSDFSLAGPIQGRLYAVGGSGARRCVEVLETAGLAQQLQGADAAELPAPCPRWELHPVELPEGRSSGVAVALGRRLLLAGGSQRAVLCFGPAGSASGGDAPGPSSSWSLLQGGDLDTLRLGAKVVAFGLGAC